jgi:hypothetical protein
LLVGDKLVNAENVVVELLMRGALRQRKSDPRPKLF